MLPAFVKVKPETSDRANSTLNIDGEEKTKGGGQAQRQKSRSADTLIRLLFGKKNNQPKETEQNLGPKSARRVDSSADKKFVPTCPICGEKHWPFHPFAPCLNVKKAHAKARQEKKARAEARKKAKAEARAKALVEKNAIAEAKEKAKYEAQLRTSAERQLAAATEKMTQLENQLTVEIEARRKAESQTDTELKAKTDLQQELKGARADIEDLQAKLKLESEQKAKAQEQLEATAERLSKTEVEAQENTKALNEALAKAEEKNTLPYDNDFGCEFDKEILCESGERTTFTFTTMKTTGERSKTVMRNKISSGVPRKMPLMVGKHLLNHRILWASKTMSGLQSILRNRLNRH